MSRDSIVDEVRAAREAYASQFNFDLRAISRDLREKARISGRTIVSLPPRRRESSGYPTPETSASPESASKQSSREREVSTS